MSASLEARAKAAEKIAAEPQRYKVCEGCGSILLKTANICPICHSYRFDQDPSAVVEQAHILGAREATSVTDEDLVN
jgi:recombinational DNA repair protein RecR